MRSVLISIWFLSFFFPPSMCIQRRLFVELPKDLPPISNGNLDLPERKEILNFDEDTSDHPADPDRGEIHEENRKI